MRLLKGLLTLLMTLLSISGKGGDKLELSGYLSEMPSVIWNSDSAMWQGLIHNRINLFWHPASSVTGSLQLRNQVHNGDMVLLMDVDEGFKTENYALPLTYHRRLGKSYFLSLAIDRAWIQLTRHKLEIKFGRQRINWGQSFVWNPNDLFNSYSFFDFDYPERPGADALRVCYYPNYNSSIDMAARIDSAGKIVGAGLLRFTKWNTEFQFMGGYYSKRNMSLDPATGTPLLYEDEDIVGGIGFSGGINSLSIRGEMSYFYSLIDQPERKNLFLTSLGMDYLTAKNLVLMFEFLYQNRVNLSLATLTGLSSSSLSQDVKSLAFTKYNFFGQAAYPITPLLEGSLSGMFFYDKDLMGFYAGPSLEYSLSNNLNLAVFFQLFMFEYENPVTAAGEWTSLNFAFLRLKWHY